MRTEDGDRKIFKREMQKLAAAFPHEEIGEMTYQVFWEDLEEFSLEVVVGALRWARREGLGFPKIKHLRERAFDLVASIPTKVLRIEDKRDEEPLVDPEEIRRLVASLDRKGVGKPVPKVEPGDRGSPMLKGKEARDFEKKRRVAKKKAREMGWEV